MKYIMLTVEIGEVEREVPVIFPDFMVHSEVFRALMKTSNPNDGKIITDVVSAGFLNSGDMHPRCHGESITLKVKTRGEVDDNIIQMFDYLHGIKHA